MAEIKTRICDRCGKHLKYDGVTSKLKNVFKKGKSVKVLKLIDGNPDGYSYSYECFELCAQCTKEFVGFLKNEKQ